MAPMPRRMSHPTEFDKIDGNFNYYKIVKFKLNKLKVPFFLLSKY